MALDQGLFAASVSARFDRDEGSASKLSHLVVGRRPGFLATCASPYGCLTWKLASLERGKGNQDGSCSYLGTLASEGRSSLLHVALATQPVLSRNPRWA